MVISVCDGAVGGMQRRKRPRRDRDVTAEGLPKVTDDRGKPRERAHPWKGDRRPIERERKRNRGINTRLSSLSRCAERIGGESSRRKARRLL